MKWLVTALTLFLALNVHAADRKLGNVVAVEREITNIYQTCMNQLDPKDQGPYYTCKISAVQNDKELALSNKNILFLNDPTCVVEGGLQNSSIFIMYNSADLKADPAISKNCLRKSLGSSDSLKMIVYTLE